MLIKRTFLRLKAKQYLLLKLSRVKNCVILYGEKIKIDFSIIKNNEYLKCKNKYSMCESFRTKRYFQVPGIPKVNLYFLPKKHNIPDK